MQVLNNLKYEMFRIMDQVCYCGVMCHTQSSVVMWYLVWTRDSARVLCYHVPMACQVAVLQGTICWYIHMGDAGKVLWVILQFHTNSKLILNFKV